MKLSLSQKSESLVLCTCCVCQKIKQDDQWIADPHNQPNIPRSHTYCPECFTSEMNINFPDAGQTTLRYGQM